MLVNFNLLNSQLASDAPATGYCLRAKPLPGEYALREAPPGRFALHEWVDPIDPDYDSELSSDDEVATLSRFANVYEFWSNLFRLKVERRTKSPVVRAIEKLFGSRLRYEADYLTAAEICLSSRWLAREYWLEQLNSLVAHARRLAQRLAAVRLSLLQRLIKPTSETGSSAAIAKRLNPLGAPPQLA